MRPFFCKLVSCILLVSFFNYELAGDNSTMEARMIRRVFLDVKKVPPSPAELEWYLIYNTKSYEKAVDWIVNSTNNYTLLKTYLLSDKYKQKESIKMDQLMLDNIIKYQSGNLNNSLDEASTILVRNAISCGEDNTVDTIDYISTCLMARPTRTQEINELLQIFRGYPNDKDGYLAVLDKIKTYPDFFTK